jgi:pSer/pThr/pTyr-binding forkhead associated (FHA) protein
MSVGPRLIVTDALGRREIPIDKPLLTLGRRSESDVRLSGGGISRHHAEIVAANGAFRLRDCESKFGTS